MVDMSQLVSHRFRGFSKHENTIEGLLAALDFGVSQVEFDLLIDMKDAGFEDMLVALAKRFRVEAS